MSGRSVPAERVRFIAGQGACPPLLTKSDLTPPFIFLELPKRKEEKKCMSVPFLFFKCSRLPLREPPLRRRFQPDEPAVFCSVRLLTTDRFFSPLYSAPLLAIYLASGWQIAFRVAGGAATNQNPPFHLLLSGSSKVHVGGDAFPLDDPSLDPTYPPPELVTSSPKVSRREF